MKKIAPYRKGYLKVSDGHRLYFECCGNPSGVPILFLHGGPGSGFVERHKEGYDLKKVNLVLFDQRGAGRSKPFAELRANTTPLLIDDINKILDHTGIERAIVVGGSWGTTLALVYAIQHPERVAGLLLRAIFLGDATSIRFFFGGSIKQHAPEVWQRFIEQVPANKRRNSPQFYFKKMRSRSRRTRERYCYEWARYEMAVASLEMTEAKIEEYLREFSYLSLAPLEAHYLHNNCFLPNGYILKNATKVAGKPVSILHGRYDIISSIRDAYRLHKKLPGSRFVPILAGHSGPEFKRVEKAELRRIIAEAF